MHHRRGRKELPQRYSQREFKNFQLVVCIRWGLPGWSGSANILSLLFFQSSPPPVSLSHSHIFPRFSYLHNSTGPWLFFSLSWWASDARIETEKQQALAFIRGMSWEEGRVMVRLHLHLLCRLSSSFARDQLMRAHNGSIKLDDGGCREVGRSALQCWKRLVPNGRVWEREVW